MHVQISGLIVSTKLMIKCWVILHFQEDTDVDNEAQLLKQQLEKAKAEIGTLKKKLRNAKDRERRSKRSLATALDEVKAKNMLNGELQVKLDMYSGR